MEPPTSPTSPLSPTFAHPLDDGLSPRLPQLQVVTTFPLNSVLGRRPSISHATVPATNQFTGPPTPNAGFRAHRSHRGTSSNASFPSPIEAILMQPLSSLPTPRSAHTRMSIDTLLNPLTSSEIDGRQSRMAMRSPVPMSGFSPMSLCSPTPTTIIRSPILEQVVALPLRLNTIFPQAPVSPMDMESCMNTFSTAIPSRPKSRTNSRASSRTRWTPTHTRSPAISHPPSNILTDNTHSRSRSPIRNPPTTTSTTPPTHPRRKHSPPPHYHVTLTPSLASTLNATHPPNPSSHHPILTTPRSLQAYTAAITHLSTPLVPLVSVTNGLSHPQFPTSLLQYHLLTHEQLDDLARWYHQVEPAREESFMYPAWITPFTGARKTAGAGGGSKGENIRAGNRNGDGEAGPEYRPSSGFEQVTLTTKRRRWGRFIGLRGCETPTTTKKGFGEGEEAEEGGRETTKEEEEEGLVERMEREWRNAMNRAREEEMLREKGWRGRW